MSARRTFRPAAPAPAPDATQAGTSPVQPMRLGFPVKVMARPDLKSGDARRWQSNPHLRTSLEYLDAVLDHLDRHDIRMYRMASDIAPYATHPDMPQFHGMVAESAAELAAFGAKARGLGIRLSFHPSQYVVLNSPDPELVRRSTWDLLSQAEMLDHMGLDEEAVLVIHVGGAYGDRVTSRERWAQVFPTLPEPVRRRLVLEHDDIRFSAADVLWVHEQVGVRLIFDHQHFWCLNPENLALRPTVEAILRSWPDGQRPKLHFSTPNNGMRELKRRDKTTRRIKTIAVAPVWTGHADFCSPFEFAGFMREVAGLTFDVMLESKVKDLALLRLRPDLLRYAPDVAVRFGLTPDRQEDLAEQEAEVLEEEDA